MRSPLRNTSRGSISSRRTIASPRPRSTTTLPYSTRLTMPLTISLDAILVFVVLTVALGLAHLLHDHLLGRLRGDAAVFERRQRVGDGVADLRGRMAPARIFEADLERRIFDCVDHQHVARQMQFAAFRIDLRAHFGLAAVARARRLGDRVLHGAEHDLAIDRLFAGDCVRDLQQFEFVGAYRRHGQSPLRWLARRSWPGAPPTCPC